MISPINHFSFHITNVFSKSVAISLAHFFTQAVGSVATGAGAQLAARITCQGPDCQRALDSLSPYEAALPPDLNASCPAGYQKLPKRLPKYYLTGMQFEGSGRSACLIETNLQALQKCADTIRIFEEFEMANQITFPKEAYDHKGTLVETRTTPKIKAALGMNPQKYQNAIAAKKIGDEFLSGENFLDQEDEILIEFIKKIHAAYMKDLVGSAGNFRSIEVYILRETISQNNFPAGLVEKGKISLEDAGYIFSARGKALKDYTPQERAAIQKVADLTAAASEVDENMLNFVQTLKRYYKQEAHPVALASWAHCHLTKIHPFEDGNGRVARMLMNVILAKGGYTPLIIPNTQDYQKAIRQDNQTPGHFTHYLSKNVIPWNKQQNKLALRANCL